MISVGSMERDTRFESVFRVLRNCSNYSDKHSKALFHADLPDIFSVVLGSLVQFLVVLCSSCRQDSDKSFARICENI